MSQTQPCSAFRSRRSWAHAPAVLPRTSFRLRALTVIALRVPLFSLSSCRSEIAERDTNLQSNCILRLNYRTDRRFYRETHTDHNSAGIDKWLLQSRLGFSAVAMSASIELNGPHNHITNLDVITGRVVVNLPSEAAIGGIQVKLEGESKTRLTGPRHPNGDPDKKRTELEVHKVRFIWISGSIIVVEKMRCGQRLTGFNADTVQSGDGVPDSCDL